MELSIEYMYLIIWLLCVVFVFLASNRFVVFLGMLFMAFVNLEMYNSYDPFAFSLFLIFSFAVGGIGLTRLFPSKKGNRG